VSRWRRFWSGYRLRIELRVGSRLLLFAAVDAVIVATSLINVLVTGGEPRNVYLGVVLLPSLLLGLPILADVVALERRAGSLDLALSVPHPEAYFTERIAAVCGLLLAQGWTALLALWATESFAFPLLPALLQAAAMTALLGAAVLFWAVRLKTAGAVWFATLITVALLGRWFFATPIPLRGTSALHPLVGGAEETLEWAEGMAVLLLGATFFFLHARRRLERPERMLA
jgi:hypothetical protein